MSEVHNASDRQIVDEIDKRMRRSAGDLNRLHNRRRDVSRILSQMGFTDLDCSRCRRLTIVRHEDAVICKNCGGEGEVIPPIPAET